MNFKTDNEVCCIPHWDAKNCWGKSPFHVCAQAHCSEQAGIDGVQRTEQWTEASTLRKMSKAQLQSQYLGYCKLRPISNANLLTEGNLHGSFTSPSVKLCYKDTAKLLPPSSPCLRVEREPYVPLHSISAMRSMQALLLIRWTHSTPGHWNLCFKYLQGIFYSFQMGLLSNTFPLYNQQRSLSWKGA